jgi:cell division protein FtsL
MKKSSKPAIFIVILFLILVTIVLLAAQGLKFKCEELIRERTRLDSEIRSQRTNRVNMVASFQMLTSEDRIKEFASKELGLVEGELEQNKKIVIKEDQIREINKELDDLYE